MLIWTGDNSVAFANATRARLSTPAYYEEPPVSTSAPPAAVSAPVGRQSVVPPVLSPDEKQERERLRKENEARREKLIASGASTLLADAAVYGDDVDKATASALLSEFQYEGDPRTGGAFAVNGARINALADRFFRRDVDGWTGVQRAQRVLGDAVPDFAKFITHTHSASGNDARMFDTFLNMADSPEVFGSVVRLGGAEVLSRMSAGYFRYMGGLFQAPDSKEAPGGPVPFKNINPLGQARADAFLMNTVATYRERGLPCERLFDDPIAMRTLSEMNDVAARLDYYGLSVEQMASAYHRSFGTDVGAYVAAVSGGGIIPSDNIAGMVKGMVHDVQGIMGGPPREISGAGGQRFMTGDPRVYRDEPARALAAASDSQGCDAIARMIQRGLLRYGSVHRSPKGLQDTVRQMYAELQKSDGSDEAKSGDQRSAAQTGWSGLVDTVTEELMTARVFDGDIGRLAASNIVHKVLERYAVTGLADVKTAVDELAYFTPAFDSEYAPDDIKSMARVLRDWAHYNSVHALEMNDLTAKMAAHFKSLGVSADAAVVMASRELQKAKSIEDAGGNPFTVVDNVFNYNWVYYPELDPKTKKQVTYADTGLRRWYRKLRNVELAKADWIRASNKHNEAHKIRDLKTGRTRVATDAEFRNQQAEASAEYEAYMKVVMSGATASARYNATHPSGQNPDEFAP